MLLEFVVSVICVCVVGRRDFGIFCVIFLIVSGTIVSVVISGLSSFS